MRTLRTSFPAAIAVLLAVLTHDAAAQTLKWPVRPVRIVVPFSVGSGSDLTTRILGERLAARWGQPVVVDNRPGGAGILGMIEFRKSSPDGHDFLMGSAGDLSTNPHVNPNLPEVRERFEGGGFEITGGSPAQAVELIRSDSARMRDVVNKKGIRPGQ